MSVLDPRLAYKPFSYPWAHDYWKAQQQVHWLPDEVPMHGDVKDWQFGLEGGEKELLTQIFRFFTQADLDVNNCYMRQYSKMEWAPEVSMMLTAFANMETIHVAAYSHLMETVGMPESEYSVFMDYKAMKDKHDFTSQFTVDPNDPYSLALQLALFGAFTEGLQLFASFAILLNFPRFNKMKGMGQIIAWSVRDESMHCEAIIKLYKTVRDEFKLDKQWLETEIEGVCRKVVALEDNFIDLAFSAGPIKGLTAQEVKDYIRYIANRRMNQLGFPAIYSIHTNPLPWLDEMMGGIEHANFFEARATEYSKSASKGDWGNVTFGKQNFIVYTKPGCPYCVKAKEFLALRGHAVTEIDLTHDLVKVAEMRTFTSMKTWPIIFRDDDLIGGYDDLVRTFG